MTTMTGKFPARRVPGLGIVAAAGPVPTCSSSNGKLDREALNG